MTARAGVVPALLGALLLACGCSGGSSTGASPSASPSVAESSPAPSTSPPATTPRPPATSRPPTTTRPPSLQPRATTVRGRVVAGAHPGCLELVGSQGRYVLLGQTAEALRPGDDVVVIGRTQPQVHSACAGAPLAVDEVRGPEPP